MAEVKDVERAQMLQALEDALIYIRGFKTMCAGLYAQLPDGTQNKLDAGSVWVQANDVANWLEVRVQAFREPKQSDQAGGAEANADLTVH